jgi:hypothetical protein
MKVYINDKEVHIFSGACIRDALLAHSPRSIKLVATGKLSVFDRFGNRTEIDGPLIDGQRLTLKKTYPQ